MAKGGFRGPMGGGMNMNMIKQAQKMQQDMLKMQEELEVKQYEAAAGGGVVKAVVNGKHEVVSLTIDLVVKRQEGSSGCDDQAGGRGPRGRRNAAGYGRRRGERGHAQGRG